MREEIADGADQIARPPLLANSAVDPGDDGQVTDVDVADDGRAQRREGVESLGACPLPIRALQISSGDVVAARVASYRRDCTLRISVAKPGADDGDQLTLVLDLCALRWQDDGLAIGDDGRRRFEE